MQVVAARLSALPPDGHVSREVDIAWYEEAVRTAEDGVASHPYQIGIHQLRALYASVVPRVEEYRVEELAAAMRALELPAVDYAHLREQPLLANADNAGACVPLERCVAAMGVEIRAWASIDETLPPVPPAAEGETFGGVETLRIARQSLPPAVAAAGSVSRADLVVRFWARLDSYLATLVLGHAELGQRGWLISAEANLRRAGADADADADAPPSAAASPLALLQRIHAHPRADDERRKRIVNLLTWLARAPPPAGPAIEAARVAMLGA